MRRTLLVLMITVIGLIMGCSTQSEKGDYIIGKENEGNVSMILVVKNISEEDTKTKSVSDFRKDGTDLMYYHIEDTNLFTDLYVGERVSVDAKTFNWMAKT